MITAADRGRAVIITEAGERGPLAACRSLAAAGYAVDAVAETRLAASFWSRSCHRRLVLPGPREHPEAFAAALTGLVRAQSYAVLVPGGEATLLAVADHGERLSPFVRTGLPTRDVIEKCLDKTVLLREGAAVGMPPPASIVCTPSEARAAARQLGYPIALKPSRSILRQSSGMRQAGTKLVTTDEEVQHAVKGLGTPVIVQRFERAGERLSCAGVFAAGELLGLAVARYERTWPPSAGAASFARTIRPHEQLVTAATDLLLRLGWEGIFELEVLGLPGGGLAVMDLNPRLFGWLALAIAAGADLPAIWCDFLLGRKRSPVIARPGVAYRWEEAELGNLVLLCRRGRIREAATMLVPSRGVVHAHFRVADPLPLTARFADLGRRTVKRVRRRDILGLR